MSDNNATTSRLTIAILSNQCLVWLGLQKILENNRAVPMVVHSSPGRTADLLRDGHRPDVFIVDLETQRDPVSTLQHIREEAPASKIVLLCGLSDKDRTCEALADGVDGIIFKVQPPAVILAVIEALYSSVNCPAYSERESGAEGRTPVKRTGNVEAPSLGWPEALTEREREIIRLVEQGLSNKDIAYRLSISDSTVRHHMTSIFDKVGVPNRQKLLVHVHDLRATPV